MTTTAFDRAPSSGYRDDFNATVHDVDDRHHTVAVDFPVAVDSFKTDFAPGAFEDGWRRRLPVMCVNHDESNVVGHAISAQSLPDRHRVVGQFSNFADVPRAREAYAHIRDGDYPGFSFHYRDAVAGPHPSGARGVLRYSRARMVEFGPVVSPSIPNTSAAYLRSAANSLLVGKGGRWAVQFALDEAELRSLGRALEEALRRSAANCASQGVVPQRVRRSAFNAATRAEEAYVQRLDAVEDELSRRFGYPASGYRSTDGPPAGDGQGGNPNRGAQRCPVCQGLGHLINGNPSVVGEFCYRCNGTGWIS